MPGRSPGPSVKDDKTYEALLRQGASKEKAARVANASSNEGRSKVSRRGGRAGSYEDMTREQLSDRAKRVGIEGRSKMSKPQLINSLRNH